MITERWQGATSPVFTEEARLSCSEDARALRRCRSGHLLTGHLSSGHDRPIYACPGESARYAGRRLDAKIAHILGLCYSDLLACNSHCCCCCRTLVVGVSWHARERAPTPLLPQNVQRIGTVKYQQAALIEGWVCHYSHLEKWTRTRLGCRRRSHRVARYCNELKHKLKHKPRSGRVVFHLLDQPFLAGFFLSKAGREIVRAQPRPALLPPGDLSQMRSDCPRQPKCRPRLCWTVLLALALSSSKAVYSLCEDDRRIEDSLHSRTESQLQPETPYAKPQRRLHSSTNDPSNYRLRESPLTDALTLKQVKGECKGVTSLRQSPAQAELTARMASGGADALQFSDDQCAAALRMPKVALMFLTTGDMPHGKLWREWFEIIAGGLQPLHPVNAFQA